MQLGEAPQTPANSLPNHSERLRVASAASIRKGPSPSHDIIGTVQAGAEVQVLTRESGWVQFIDPVSGGTGWIYSKFLVSDTVTPDTESAEGPPAAQLPTDEPPGAKEKQKGDGIASPETPPPKRLAQEEPKNRKALGRKAKGTAQTSEEQLIQEALPSTKLPRRPDEYSELPPDAEFVPPRHRRFGIFARRRMLRDGAPEPWEEEFPPPRY
jgi:uncharacterized protein YgiM (DUF1202 family)